MKLLIVGCPHSGTKFTAEVLRSAGIACGHEAIFTLYGYKPEVDNVAEVSWEATFHLGTPTVPPDVVIAHQTRDPLDWLNSWLRSYHSGPAWLEGPAWSILETAYPGLQARRDQDPTRAALWLWVEMNQRCMQHTSRRHRVEDLCGKGGVRILEELTRAAGLSLDASRLRAALASTGSGINHHPGKSSYVPLTWKSLPCCPARDEFKRLSRAYGYK